MNLHLQTILQFIQRAEHLSEEDKNALIKEAKAADRELEITAFKLGRTEKVKHTTAVLLEETILELESKRKAVEVQNRELEIEAALEKVRSRSLAMHHSDELREVVAVVYDRLRGLDFRVEEGATIIIIFLPNSKIHHEWIADSERSYPKPFEFPDTDHSIKTDLLHAHESGLDSFTKLYPFEEKNKYLEYRFLHTEFGTLPEHVKTMLRESKSYGASIALEKNSAILFASTTGKLLSDIQIGVLKRFAKVFEQSYARFLDLQKAEAQAREAQIETALEKVRSRSLAMHHSDELKEVVAIVFEKFRELNFQADGGAGIVIFDDQTKGLEYWAANPDYISASRFTTPYFDHVINNDIWKTRENGGDFNSNTYSFEAKNSYWDYLIEHTDFRNLPKEHETMIYKSKSMTNAFALSKHSAIGVITYLGKPFSKEQIEIIKRFARVFEQAYTRFLDLQNAEAQAREAQIQLALERVRARTMAMQHSDELSETVYILLQQFKELGENPDQATIGIINEEERVIEYWVTMYGNQLNRVFRFSIDEPHVTQKIYNAWKKQEKSLVIDLSGQELREFSIYRESMGGAKLNEAETRRIINVAIFSKGLINVQSNEYRSKESINLLERFAAVFEQTYTRFLDLQKAEAQARESQIQLALERVRARTMAMQRSDELPDAALLLSNQVNELGLQLWGTSFQLWAEDRKQITVWSCIRDIMISPFKVPATEDPLYVHISEAEQKGEALYLEELRGKAFEDHIKYMMSIPAFREGIAGVLDQGIILPASMIFHAAYFLNGFILFISSDPCPEAHTIFIRFAKVFEQTYTRFLDLKKAEDQAREAQIEAALEKVRSRSLAMHNSEELKEVVAIVFEKLHELNFQADGGVGIVIFDDQTKGFDYWAANPDYISASRFPTPYFDHVINNDMWRTRENGGDFNSHTYSYEEKNSFWDYLIEHTDFKHLPEENKTMIYESKSMTNAFAFSKHSAIGVITYLEKPFTAEQIEIVKRFARVFEQAYTRFLDLEKAEAQARAAKIEAALERVRSRSLAMHKSDELKEVITVVFENLKELGVTFEDAGIQLFKAGTKDSVRWVAAPHQMSAPILVNLPYSEKEFGESEIFRDYWMAKEKREDIYNKTYSFSEKNKYFDYLERSNEVNHIPASLREFQNQAPDYTVTLVTEKNSALLVDSWSGQTISIADYNVLKRVASVFDQAYTRFLDLQRAEAQAREAKIEAAMERTRTQSMIMQHSNELDNTLRVFHEQVLLLGIHSAFSFLWLPDENKDRHIFWAAWAENFPSDQLTKDGSTVFKSKAINYPLDRNEPATAQCLVDWKSDEPVHSYHVPPAEVENYFASWKELLDGVEKLKPEYFPGGLYYGEAFMKYGCFGVMIESPLPEEEKKILNRFAIEFERTYTRFLDLQKAEAQAREAQIEAALEKIRSRSLAIQKSDELKDVINTVFEKLRELDVAMDSACILTFKEGTKDHTSWAANPDLFTASSVYVSFFDDPIFSALYEAREKGEGFFGKAWSFEEKNSFWKHLFEHTDYKYLSEDVKKAVFNFEGWGFSGPFSKNSATLLVSYSEKLFSDQDNEIINRFGKVFEQAYIRFLDLQKAEAQAREAQIETGLERVRSRTMGMQKSEELKEVIQVVYEQFVHLNINVDHTGFVIDYKARDDYNIWIADPLGVPSQVTVPYFDSVYYNRFNEAKAKGEDFFATNLTFEEKNKFYQKLFEYVPGLPEQAKEFYFTCPGLAVSTVLLENVCLYIENFSGISYSDQENGTLMRFGKVFQQTYTRFLDLQKAEAQAMEAVKQASVDRVRAEIASMRTTNDLERIQPLIWNELTTLGVPFIRCGIFIMDDPGEKVHMHLSTPDGKAIAVFHLPYDAPFNIPQIVQNWHKKKIFKQHWDAQKFIEFTKYLVQEGAIASGEKYLTENRPTDLYLHFLPFLQGMLYVGSSESLSEDALQLVQNLAAAFSTAYARYDDFNKLEAAKEQIEKTLVDLKQTQAQLVQSEKMASLGELTAGIAHEIQNPLNFVNNFSEVNRELIQEMKNEIRSDNKELALSIANDIDNNEEKINHHGKRADAIVRGMLQHSRETTGQKESVNINALAEEYLRLSYQGLRAKDKSFNATLQTHLDPGMGAINVIPQDIGRVLLNLYNNAFYAVAPPPPNGGIRKKLTNSNPTVWVTTKKMENKVMISVRDNGPGISQKVVDKIFQPFFTTKPTGQGTGLGLSLSYDIIKAHGGELKVETKEGEGAEFIIQLPV